MQSPHTRSPHTRSTHFEIPCSPSLHLPILDTDLESGWKTASATAAPSPISRLKSKTWPIPYAPWMTQLVHMQTVLVVLAENPRVTNYFFWLYLPRCLSLTVDINSPQTPSCARGRNPTTGSFWTLAVYDLQQKLYQIPLCRQVVESGSSSSWRVSTQAFVQPLSRWTTYSPMTKVDIVEMAVVKNKTEKHDQLPRTLHSASLPISYSHVHENLTVTEEMLLLNPPYSDM